MASRPFLLGRSDVRCRLREPPAEQLFAEFGFTVDNVVAKAQALLK